MEDPARPKRRAATYEDLLRVPEHQVAEIVDGELVVSPRPAFPHARSARGLAAGLDGFERDPGGEWPGGWWILVEPELHLGRDVVVPDLAGWRRERMPVFPRIAACTLAPDWLCEIASPATGALDRVRKMRIYAREKVGHFWVIDPDSETLEVYRQSGDLWALVAAFDGPEKVRAEPFEAVELDLARLWVPRPPEAPAGPEAPAAPVAP